MTLTPDAERRGQREGEAQDAPPLLPFSAPALATGLWLSPLAVICGAAASLPAAFDAVSLVPLAMAVLLALSWLVLWAVIADMPWTGVLASWDAWAGGRPLRMLPYARPDSDAAKAAARLGQLRGWARGELLPRRGAAMIAAAAAVGVMAVLAAALGPQPILLTLAAICLPQIAAIASRGSGQPNPILRAALMVTLPMLLGCGAFAPLSLAFCAAAAGVGLLFVARTALTRARDVGYAIALAALLITRQPVGAFMLAVTWAPQALLQLRLNSRAWAVAAMLIVAFSFAQ